MKPEQNPGKPTQKTNINQTPRPATTGGTTEKKHPGQPGQGNLGGGKMGGGVQNPNTNKPQRDENR